MSVLLEPKVNSSPSLSGQSGQSIELQKPRVLFLFIKTPSSEIFIGILFGKDLGLVGSQLLQKHPCLTSTKSTCELIDIGLYWRQWFFLGLSLWIVLNIGTLHFVLIVNYFYNYFYSSEHYSLPSPFLSQSQLQLMSNIKRWAKSFFALSPIFADPLFSKPNNQLLVAINPRLFAAYCIQMNRQKLYSRGMVDELIKEYYAEPNYWIQYTRRLMNLTTIVSNSQTGDNTQDAKIRQQFHALKSKLFNREITQQQFTSLCKAFESLLVKGEVDQLDLYVLDLSFSTIQQIVEVSSINLQAALQSIGRNSLQLIQQEMKKQVDPNIFQLISLFNRIKDSANFPPQLANLYSMLQGSKDMSLLMRGESVCPKKQALGYMLWLLHVNQLGQFVYKFVKQNYLFSRYCQSSVHITCSLLQVVDVSPELKLSELIILNEVVHKLQDIQEQRQFFQHVKRNVQIQLRLKALKEKIQDLLNEEHKTQGYQWIAQLDKYEIDFQSSLSVNIIKKMINRLVEETHFGIILEKESYGKLLNICQRMKQFELYRKLQFKLKRKPKDRKKKYGLLSLLQGIYLDEPLPSQRSFKIYSIYQLKRIKNLLQRLSHKEKQYESIFSAKELELLRNLTEKLSKPHKELYSHQISPILEPLFDHFKL